MLGEYLAALRLFFRAIKLKLAGIARISTPGGAQWWEMARRTRPMPDSAIEYLQSLLDDPKREIVPLTELQPWLRNPS